MNTTFGELTQPFIKATLLKNNTSVLELIIFHETIRENHKKSFRVLSCVIYTIIKIMSVFMIYIVNQKIK